MSTRTWVPNRVAVSALLLATVTLTGACGGQRTEAAGRFRPTEPGTLTVATAKIPVPGFWEGTPANVTGGFEWALANALADHLGLGRVRVVIVPFPDLVNGDLGGADLGLAQLKATESRRQVLGFSEPYLPATPAVLVRAGTSIADLATARESTWAVQAATTLEAFLDDVVRPDVPPLRPATETAALEALEARRVDAVLLDLPVAATVATRSGDSLEVAAQFAEDDSLSAAIPKGSENGPALDSAIRAFEADGTIRGLVREWLGSQVLGQSAAPIIRTRK